MTVQEMQQITSSRPTAWPKSEALHAGLTLILADTAASHLQAGDVERATLCMAEAERSLSILRTRNPMQLLS